MYRRNDRKDWREFDMKRNMQSHRSVLLLILGVVLCGLAIISIEMFLTQRGIRGERHDPSDGQEVLKRHVVMYSSLQELQLETLKKAFESRYPDIQLDYYCAGTGKILTKVSTERQQGGIQADLLWIGDPDSYISFLDADLLVPYSSPHARDIPSAFSFSDPRLTTARLIVMGFAYNTRLINGDALPASWEDLPKISGVVFADPTSSGTMLYTLRTLCRNPKYGKEFWKALATSGAEVCSGSAATGYQVGAGNYQVGIVPDYVAAMVRNMGLPVGFVYPDDLVVIPSPIALFRDSPNPDEGRMLFDFILSDEGQRVLASVDIIPARGNLAAAINSFVESEASNSQEDRQKLLEWFDMLFIR